MALRGLVTHTESYLFVTSEFTLRTYFEINADKSRRETVGEDEYVVAVQRPEVYAYELQFGTDRSFSDITRMGKIRGYILGHMWEGSQTHDMTRESPGRCACPDQVQGLGVERCPLRKTMLECNMVEEWQLSGETQISCIWEVPLFLYPCTSRLGSRFLGSDGFSCGSISAESRDNIFDVNVYGRIIPILMPDPQKQGDIPMIVSQRASGSAYTDNPNPFTKFLPYKISTKCGDKRYLETRFDPLKYGEGKLMNVRGLTKDVYGKEFLPDPYKWDCVACPEGASCKGPIYWKGMKPLFGFWRARRVGMIEFYECIYPWACLGVMNLDFEAREIMKGASNWKVSDYMPEAAVVHPDAEWAKRQYAIDVDSDGVPVTQVGGVDQFEGPYSNGTRLTQSDSNMTTTLRGNGLAKFGKGPILILKSDDGQDLLEDFNLALLNHREKCQLGYRGPVCGLCLDEPKYFMNEGGCVLCEGNSPTVQQIINTVLIGLVVSLYCFAYIECCTTNLKIWMQWIQSSKT